MSRYINKRHKFEIELPDGWSGPGLFKNLLGDSNPEFYGPNRSGLKFAIGPISPEPSAEEQQYNLKRIAMKLGHGVVSVGTIEVYNKEHATIVCLMPLMQPPPSRPFPKMVLKHYSLIFDGIEYLASSSVDFLPEEKSDEIIKTFRLY